MGDRNVPVNIVILGNRGHGKSSFGNFILNQKKFPVSSSDPCRELSYGAGNRDNFTMKVIEMPVYPYREMLSRAYEICDHNLHLFLLVIKFDLANYGNCFHVFDEWREILGSDIFARRGVVVITFGDEFTKLKEKNKTPDKTFSEWCCEQGGYLQNLLEECNPRRILFDNNAHTDHTFVELSNYMRQLSYTDNRFSKEFTKRQKNSSFWGDCVKLIRNVVAFVGVVVACVVVAVVFTGLKHVVFRRK